MVIPTLVPTTCGWNLLWKAANQKAGWFKVCPEVQYKINKDCFKQKITGSYSGVQQQNLWSWKWAFKCLCMHICSHALHHHDHHFISKALKNNISAVEKNERSSVKHWISYKFIHKCQIKNSTTLKSELCALVCFSGTISPTSQVHGEVIRLPDQRVSAFRLHHDPDEGHKPTGSWKSCSSVFVTGVDVRGRQSNNNPDERWCL